MDTRKNTPKLRRSLPKKRGDFVVCVALMMAGGCRPQPVTPTVLPEKAQYDEGQKQLKLGNMAQAQASFDTATRLNATFAPAYFAEAEIDARSGNVAKALTTLETLYRAAPQTPHVLCRLAELHAISGHFVEGVTASKKALQHEPTCSRAKVQYALQLVAANEVENALPILKTVHQETPENERVTLILVQLLARQGQLTEAWKVMDTLPARSSLPVQADYLHGWLLAEYGRDGKRDETQALVSLNRALALSPDDAPVNLEKGKILLRSGKAHEAVPLLQKARTHSQPNVELLTALAEAQSQLKNPVAGRMKKSVKEFSALIDRLYLSRQNYLNTPENRDAMVSLARLEATLGNGKDAEALLTEVLKRDPNDAEALKLMTPMGNQSSP